MRDIANNIAARLSIRSARGVTAIEYGLIAAAIAIVLVTAVTLVGGNLINTFNTVSNSLK